MRAIALIYSVTVVVYRVLESVCSTVQDEEEDEEIRKQKEAEAEIQKNKQRQIFLENLYVMIAMLLIVILAVVTVILKGVGSNNRRNRNRPIVSYTLTLTPPCFLCCLAYPTPPICTEEICRLTGSLNYFSVSPIDEISVEIVEKALICRIHFTFLNVNKQY